MVSFLPGWYSTKAGLIRNRFVDEESEIAATTKEGQVKSAQESPDGEKEVYVNGAQVPMMEKI
jgi:hypothetical protein